MTVHHHWKAPKTSSSRCLNPMTMRCLPKIDAGVLMRKETATKTAATRRSLARDCEKQKNSTGGMRAVELERPM